MTAHINLQRIPSSQSRIPAARQPFRQRLAFDQLEDQRGGIFESVNGRDIGMIECREDARFAFEAHEAVAIGRELRWKNLDRDRARASNRAR